MNLSAEVRGTRFCPTKFVEWVPVARQTVTSVLPWFQHSNPASSLPSKLPFRDPLFLLCREESMLPFGQRDWGRNNDMACDSHVA